jgi:hypothetical protein
MDIADQLQKLHQLHVSGALSAEEFAKAKQAYLVQMVSNAPAGPEEFAKTEVVEEEIVETQAAAREGKKGSPPPLPPRPPNTPPVQYRTEEFVKTQAVEEEIVEPQAVTRERKGKRPPPLPPPLPNTPPVQYRAADFKDLYMRFLLKYISIVSVIVVFGIIVAVEPRLARDHVVTYLVAVISGAIFIAVVTGIFLYRAWAQIQDGRPRTTPGKAVGFRFIPFFSFYWEFVAVKGLAEDIERYARARGIFITPIPKGLTITYCVLVIVTGVLSGLPIPMLGPLLMIPLAVVLLILFKKIADASAAIAEAKLSGMPAAAAPAPDGTVQNAVGIVTAVSAGLAVVEKFIDTGHH